MHRVECPVGTLVIGLECGGSDRTESGMAADPAMGAFSDLMVAQARGGDE